MLDGVFADNAYYKKAPQKSEKKAHVPAPRTFKKNAAAVNTLDGVFADTAYEKSSELISSVWFTMRKFVIK